MASRIYTLTLCLWGSAVHWDLNVLTVSLITTIYKWMQGHLFLLSFFPLPLLHFFFQSPLICVFICFIHFSVYSSKWYYTVTQSHYTLKRLGFGEGVETETHLFLEANAPWESRDMNVYYLFHWTSSYILIKLTKKGILIPSYSFFLGTRD